MMTQLKGALWPTLETTVRGIEIGRAGWGSPSALAALQGLDVPAIWLCNQETGGLPAVVQRTLVTHGPVDAITLDGAAVGARWDDAHADYALLTGILPSDLAAPREAQAASVFENIERALQAAGLGFHDVVRTWLYLDKLLEWYDPFNRVRDAFFESRHVFGGFVPASTGIGSANTTGSAIIAGALAMRPKPGAQVTRGAVESPLQCPALDYRSSFSRAAEIVTPETRTVFVSGTASIAFGGETAHVGDPEKQIALTMDVVEAILATRQMTLRDTTRAIAYIKRPEYRPLWQRWLAAHNLPPNLAQEIIADVCRDDLLFEIELDAVTRLR